MSWLGAGIADHCKAGIGCPAGTVKLEKDLPCDAGRFALPGSWVFVVRPDADGGSSKPDSMTICSHGRFDRRGFSRFTTFALGRGLSLMDWRCLGSSAPGSGAMLTAVDAAQRTAYPPPRPWGHGWVLLGSCLTPDLHGACGVVPVA